jgi:hypothetical protein
VDFNEHLDGDTSMSDKRKTYSLEDNGHSFLRSGILADRVASQTKKDATPSSRYREFAMEYYERSLPFDPDAYNAFVGISRYFYHQGVQTFWGIECAFSHGSEVLDTLVRNLAWYHNSNDARRISNHLETSPQRWNQAISTPSWSWIAWRGSGISYVNFTSSVAVVISAQVEFYGGCIVSVNLPQWWLGFADPFHNCSQPVALHLNAGVLMPDEVAYASTLPSAPLFKHSNTAIRWHLPAWVVSGKRRKQDMEALYDEIMSGDVELLLLAVPKPGLWGNPSAGRSQFIFLVTKKEQNQSYRVGLAVLDEADPKASRGLKARCLKNSREVRLM